MNSEPTKQPLSREEAREFAELAVKTRSLPIAYVFWAGLGGIGAHRFYLNDIPLGFVMAFFCLVAILEIDIVSAGSFGILVIWWIYDAFQLPRMVRENNEAVLDRYEWSSRWRHRNQDREV